MYNRCSPAAIQSDRIRSVAPVMSPRWVWRRMSGPSCRRRWTSNANLQSRSRDFRGHSVKIPADIEITGNTFRKSPRPKSRPQEKHYEREETERQQSLKALFAYVQHGLCAPITASQLQQFLTPIIERKSFRSVDTRLTKRRFRQTFYRYLANLREEAQWQERAKRQ
jgi:hypothetical protein